jgi:TonB family protein
MNAFQRKITLRVVGIHAAIILVFLIGSLFRSCTRPKPPEIITFIEFGGPAPQVDVEQVSEMSNPEPEVEQPPPPEPEPAPIPEPVKKKPEPIKKPDPVKKKPEPIKKAEPVKKPEPTWKPTPVDQIKKGKKIRDSSPKAPAVSASDIRNALKDFAPTSSKTSGNPSQFNDYYARIMSLFYNRWTPPPSASAATGSTKVRISMLKNGQITKRKKIKGSGDSLYDKTVMDAVSAVSTMPSPPSNYPYEYVEITFTLDN